MFSRWYNQMSLVLVDILGIIHWCETLLSYQNLCGLACRCPVVREVVLDYPLSVLASHELQFRESHVVMLGLLPKCIVAIIV